MIILFIILFILILSFYMNDVFIGNNNELEKNLKKFEENERKYKSSNR